MRAVDAENTEIIIKKKQLQLSAEELVTDAETKWV